MITEVRKDKRTYRNLTGILLLCRKERCTLLIFQASTTKRTRELILAFRNGFFKFMIWETGSNLSYKHSSSKRLQFKTSIVKGLVVVVVVVIVVVVGYRLP